MIVKNTISACWLADRETIRKAADAAAEPLLHASPAPRCFFRADDIGVPGKNCHRMMTIFADTGAPLHMAVTPAWLTPARWQILREWAGASEFVWHQHGWRHRNHQLSGKKGEFGTNRSREDKKADLSKGLEKLEAIMGREFRPIFTPPWNRIDAETGELLAEIGYAFVSRWEGEDKKVPLPDRLPDIPVNVDLHTRTESDPETGLTALVDQFRQAAATGRVGVMLHHQRMNDGAFVFLEQLLNAVAGVSVSLWPPDSAPRHTSV